MYGGERRMPDTPIKEATQGTEVERSDGIGRALSGLSRREERQEWDRGRGKWEPFSKGKKREQGIIDFYTHTYNCTQTHTLIHALNVLKKTADSALASIQWCNWRIEKGAGEPDVISGVWRQQVRAPHRASTNDFHVKTNGQERTEPQGITQQMD